MRIKTRTSYSLYSKFLSALELFVVVLSCALWQDTLYADQSQIEKVSVFEGIKFIGITEICYEDRKSVITFLKWFSAGDKIEQIIEQPSGNSSKKEFGGLSVRRFKAYRNEKDDLPMIFSYCTSLGRVLACKYYAIVPAFDKDAEAVPLAVPNKESVVYYINDLLKYFFVDNISTTPTISEDILDDKHPEGSRVWHVSVQVPTNHAIGLFEGVLSVDLIARTGRIMKFYYCPKVSP